MKYKSFTHALLGLKGNRGFQDFEQWKIMMVISNHLFGVDTDHSGILDCLTDSAGEEGTEEYQWDIMKDDNG